MTSMQDINIRKVLALIDEAWTILHNEFITEQEVDIVARQVYNPQKFPRAYLGNTRITTILIRQPHDTEG